MKLKRAAILTFVISQSFCLYGQRGSYANDSVRYSNIEIIDAGPVENAKHCYVGNDIKTASVFSPEEVVEYAIKYNKVYVSKKIQTNNGEKAVFLERLTYGKLKLYYYKDERGSTFFFEKDSGQLTELLKNSGGRMVYKEILESNVQDCNFSAEALKHTSYNKMSLSRFAQYYNTCKDVPIRHLNYGLLAGYSLTRLADNKIQNEGLKSINFRSDHALNFGVFMDIPVLGSRFSIHPELYYQKTGFKEHYDDSYRMTDVSVNTRSIIVPVLIRYTVNLQKVRPYFDLGVICAYHYKNNSVLYSAGVYDNVVIVNQAKERIFPEKQFGYSLGGGIQRDINKKNLIYLGLRFNHFGGSADDSFGSYSFQSVIGVSL